jgi:hypothetical protein
LISIVAALASANLGLADDHSLRLVAKVVVAAIIATTTVRTRVFIPITTPPIRPIVQDYPETHEAG